MPNFSRHEDEKFFLTGENKKEFVPSIHDLPTRELSVVVPSYNEEERCKNRSLFFCLTLFYCCLMHFSLMQFYLNQILVLRYVCSFFFCTVPPMMDEALEYLEKRQVWKIQLLLQYLVHGLKNILHLLVFWPTSCFVVIFVEERSCIYIWGHSGWWWQQRSDHKGRRHMWSHSLYFIMLTINLFYLRSL